MKTFRKFRKFRIVARVVLQTKECKAILATLQFYQSPKKLSGFFSKSVWWWTEIFFRSKMCLNNWFLFSKRSCWRLSRGRYPRPLLPLLYLAWGSAKAPNMPRQDHQGPFIYRVITLSSGGAGGSEKGIFCLLSYSKFRFSEKGQFSF